MRLLSILPGLVCSGFCFMQPHCSGLELQITPEPPTFLPSIKPDLPPSIHSNLCKTKIEPCHPSILKIKSPTLNALHLVPFIQTPLASFSFSSTSHLDQKAQKGHGGREAHSALSLGGHAQSHACGSWKREGGKGQSLHTANRCEGAVRQETGCLRFQGGNNCANELPPEGREEVWVGYQGVSGRRWL